MHCPWCHGPTPFERMNGTPAPCTSCQRRARNDPSGARQLHAAEQQLRTVENNMSNWPVPDPYKAELDAIRAARATSQSRFEQRFAAERAAEIEAGHREFATTFRAAQQPPRTSAADLAKFCPPDPYGPALRALKEKTR